MPQTFIRTNPNPTRRISKYVDQEVMYRHHNGVDRGVSPIHGKAFFPTENTPNIVWDGTASPHIIMTEDAYKSASEPRLDPDAVSLWQSRDLPPYPPNNGGEAIEWPWIRDSRINGLGGLDDDYTQNNTPGPTVNGPRMKGTNCRIEGLHVFDLTGYSSSTTRPSGLQHGVAHEEWDNGYNTVLRASATNVITGHRLSTTDSVGQIVDCNGSRDVGVVMSGSSVDLIKSISRRSNGSGIQIEQGGCRLAHATVDDCDIGVNILTIKAHVSQINTSRCRTTDVYTSSSSSGVRITLFNLQAMTEGISVGYQFCTFLCGNIILDDGATGMTLRGGNAANGHDIRGLTFDLTNSPSGTAINVIGPLKNSVIDVEIIGPSGAVGIYLGNGGTSKIGNRNRINVRAHGGIDLDDAIQLPDSWDSSNVIVLNGVTK